MKTYNGDRENRSHNVQLQKQLKLTVVNIVATAELNQFVNLEALASQRGFLYDQAIYNCAYLKDKKTRAKVIIFATGKMICVGAKSFENAKHDLNYAAKRLADLGLISLTRIKPKLQNIVATADMGQHINLEQLSLKLTSLIYEPEQFAGAIYYAKELDGASILMFASGKVVFAGLKSLDSLKMAKKVIVNLASMV